VWQYFIKPLMQFFYEKKIKRKGWQALHEQELEYLKKMNAFSDI